MCHRYCLRILCVSVGFCGLIAGATANAADDLKVSQLEQDVRDLKQQVLQLGRRIETLEAAFTNSRPAVAKPIERPPIKRADEQRAWLSVANWERVRPGMSELEVIQLLGPPSTLRKSPDDDRQTLLYALEIGTGHFLTGSVAFENRRVVEVSKPTLK